MRRLLFGPLMQGGISLWFVAVLDAFGYTLAQEDFHRLTGWRIEARKFIPKVIQFKPQALRNQQRIFDGLRQIVKEPIHTTCTAAPAAAN